MRRLGAAVLAGLMAAVIVLTAAVVARSATVLTPAAGVQDMFVVRGGVIRLGSRIYLHDNGSHSASGIRKLTLESCNLVIWTDAAQGEQIMAVLIEEDETLTKLGVQAGGSGGGAKTTIWMYNRAGRKVCANWSGFGTNANLWVQLTYLNAPQGG